MSYRVKLTKRQYDNKALRKGCILIGVVVVQLLIHVRLFATPWTAVHQASPSFPISQSLLKLMSIDFDLDWGIATPKWMYTFVKILCAVHLR